MMSPQIVMIDANVLFSRTLRDWLAVLQSSPAGEVFEGFWTEDIMAEVLYWLRRTYPNLSGAQLAHVRTSVEAAFKASGRITNYEIDADFPGSDPNDAHVHSAAKACGAEIVLTDDVHGFASEGAADLLPYEIYTPDEFFILLDQTAPEVVREATMNQLMYFLERSKSVDLPDKLRAAGAPAFASRIAEHMQTMTVSNSDAAGSTESS